MPQWKDAIVKSAITGQINAEEAEKLIALISSQIKPEISIPPIREMTNDSIEASRIYQEIMQ